MSAWRFAAAVLAAIALAWVTARVMRPPGPAWSPPEGPAEPGRVR